MTLLKITAKECNSQGLTGQMSIHVELYLNTDLIGAIANKKVLLKDGDVLSIGDKYYTGFNLDSDVQLYKI